MPMMRLRLWAGVGTRRKSVTVIVTPFIWRFAWRPIAGCALWETYLGPITVMVGM